MRIIEPPRRKESRVKKGAIGLIISVVIALTASYIAYRSFNRNQEIQTEGFVLSAYSAPEPKTYTGTEEFKYFSSQEFLDLYESIAYPNTQELTEPPPITGNVEADTRIRTIAESRGYVLRSVPVLNIIKTNEPRLGSDDLLQEKAYIAWQELKRNADKDGIPLKLNSGYRSIEMQREIFLSRLRQTGVSTDQIASGSVDDKVVATLQMTALPGYSRHHTGYTIDLVCGTGAQEFKVTTCYKWLSQDNYNNAKKAGWIPSYPDGVENQGPEPEPWEYVWVGTSALLR